MKDVGYVTGSAAQAQELVIGTDVVYVHTDITLVEPKEGEEQASPVYRYHEVQYEKNEYIKLIYCTADEQILSDYGTADEP